MHEITRRRSQATLTHVQPKPIEIGEIRGESLRLHAFGCGAYDVTTRMIIAE